ncbi:ARF-like protein [Heterostelium album PN500]|uniref:ARF-like protein n=1 Tax=Heterostelium pallidum (strain ATCC 26659 / Pp 5 / PN500) TaxID=670386 RepID=D3BI29_HETP5|nr:ARF-like protein [Heterostelium album PN500]EFA78929.1 ARF-like protein [Heterostelium album PN500]|eukprot:XP_020431053.1 ARF-like protein [Heterostelium album PN500]
METVYNNIVRQSEKETNKDVTIDEKDGSFSVIFNNALPKVLSREYKEKLVYTSSMRDPIQEPPSSQDQRKMLPLRHSCSEEQLQFKKSINHINQINMFKTEYYVLILGLDGAGKTTLLEEIKTKYTKTPGLPPQSIIPTVGLNIGRIIIDNVKLIFWDLGGQIDLRTIWDKYYTSIHAVIYVVDSADLERLDESKTELERIISHHDLKDVPLLLFFNKQDLPDAQRIDILSTMFKSVTNNMKDNTDVSRNIQLQPLIAHTGQGLNEGLSWLVDNLKKNARAVELDPT